MHAGRMKQNGFLCSLGMNHKPHWKCEYQSLSMNTAPCAQAKDTALLKRLNSDDSCHWLVESPPSWSRGNNSFRPCGRDPRPVKLPNTNKQNSKASTTDRPRLKIRRSTSSHACKSSWIERLFSGYLLLLLLLLLSFVRLSRTCAHWITIAGSTYLSETRALERGSKVVSNPGDR